MSLALLDVCYETAGARAACVLAAGWDAAAPTATFVRTLAQVAPYEPGRFYLRELPCLLAVLELLPAPPATIVVDGYVWLSAQHRPGLGAHLYAALGRRTPVVGIAKSAFAGAEDSGVVVSVFRGVSRRPLHVSAAGMDARSAAAQVQRMAGPHRIPELLRLVDQLSRGNLQATG